MSELRPSFGERDTYLNLLSAAYADGRIDDEEFDRRTQGVLSAVTHKDAIAQFEGLPAPNVLPAPAKPAPPPRPVPPPSVPPQPPAGPLYSIEPAPVRFTPAPRRSDDGPGAMIVKVVVGVAAAAIGLTVIGGFISAGTAMNQFNQWGPGVVDIDGVGPVEIDGNWPENAFPEATIDHVESTLAQLEGRAGLRSPSSTSRRERSRGGLRRRGRQRSCSSLARRTVPSRFPGRRVRSCPR